MTDNVSCCWFESALIILYSVSPLQFEEAFIFESKGISGDTTATGKHATRL